MAADNILLVNLPPSLASPACPQPPPLRRPLLPPPPPAHPLHHHPHHRPPPPSLSSLSREQSLSPAQSPRIIGPNMANNCFFPLPLASSSSSSSSPHHHRHPLVHHHYRLISTLPECPSPAPPPAPGGQRRFSVADLAEAALRQQRARQYFRRSTDYRGAWAEQVPPPPPCWAEMQQHSPTSLSREPSLVVRKRRRMFSHGQHRQPQQGQRQRTSWAQQQQKQHCSGGRMPSTEERCNGDLLQPCFAPIGGNSIGGLESGGITSGPTKSIEWNLGREDGCGGGSSPGPKRNEQTANAAAAHHRQQILRRRQSGYGISITTESQAKMRCKLRKLYFLKRNKICDLSLALAIIGLAFVVLDQELTALNIVSKRSIPSLLLRSACVASTLMLIASLVNYHRTEVKIALIDSGAEDWRVALTTDRVIKLLIEICICVVCPFPGSGTISWPYISADERRMSLVLVPLDVLLSVPMFLRSYLLCRFMVLHSRQFQDAATRSIAALNRISMDFRFVIKTMMADHPMTVLVVFTCCYWICMSWMFTQCERYNGRYVSTEYYYMNSLWFIMVTFMSIGYGDVVPTSYCGRFLSITTGIVGAGVSSALIAVISRKLELSRAEKHVNNFMADSKLTNARKNAAASVLQQTWFIHKYQQRNGHKGDELRLRQHQRKFLNAINDFRRIKWDQRKLQEKGNSLLDVGKLHTEMHETLWEMHRTQDQFANMIEVLTQRIGELQQSVLAATQVQQGIQPNIPPPPPIQQLLIPLGGRHAASVVAGNGPVMRKTSMSAQLRVPHDFGAPHPPPRKYSAVHAPPHHHFHHHNQHPAHPQQHQQQQNRSPKPVILGGFGPSTNLGLTNSCSSPCLQKSQQHCRTTMRVLQDEEDECTPLMMGGGPEEMA